MGRNEGRDKRKVGERRVRSGGGVFTRYYSLIITSLSVVKQRHMMCEDLKHDVLQCPDDGNVLEIYKAYVGQDVQELFKCLGYDVSFFQNPCTSFPDMTKKTKLKCDGRKSCNINESLSDRHVLSTCRSHKKSFNVEFGCRVNSTKGNYAGDAMNSLENAFFLPH